ncbi:MULTISPECIES: hypothetical protein [Cyanophyceae]|uniref:Phycobilisome protein n=1 Tax=Leptolyngbya subtilissima DQ-A4 TaxID=2933933 RepID=A0ABV0K0G9_9CYAN|nr:hypothetical protein [Nodosilinea sp. FACHB-141]MBD2111002.1 hypothetical protein [Nodosilinea sp. FACHB-141]
MNHILSTSIRESDGRYLSDSELRPLAQFVASFDTRFKTYTRLRADSETLVLNTLRQLMVSSYRDVVQVHGAKCQRDMLYTLECIAKAVLLDDPDGFMEEYVMWMQNITRALHKQDSAIVAYRSLQAQVLTALPETSAQLINSYLDKLIQALSDGL